MAPKKRFLRGFLQFSGNTHNFVKNDPKFENKSLFDPKFYGASHKKISDPKADIWGLGPKN